MKPISELELFKIGEIFKSHGYKGELVIKLFIDFNKIVTTELLFLKIEGNMVPFFITEKIKKYKNSDLIVKFENIDSETDAKELLTCNVYTERNNVNDFQENSETDLENFDVFDKENYIGKSANFLNIPSNPVLAVKTKNNKEILIPFNDHFIVEIQKQELKIILDLPDGLIDINT